jgi:hypothetical protein
VAATSEATGLPNGTRSYEMPLDGYERLILLKAKLTIDHESTIIDFTGHHHRPRSTASTARAPIRMPIRCSA